MWFQMRAATTAPAAGPFSPLTGTSSVLSRNSSTQSFQVRRMDRATPMTLGDFIEQAERARPDTATACDGFVYGTNEIADSLWDLCAAERYWACDSLFDLDLHLPVGGEYIDFGATCGDRLETDLYCTEEFGTIDPVEYGDDPFLDDLHDACFDLDGDACDTLWMATVGYEDAAYFDVAATCGGTEEFDVCGVATSSLSSPMTPDLPMMTTAVPHEAERRGSWPADISPPT